MAKAAITPQKSLEREYVIPLRSKWMKAPRYKRTRKGIIAIKEYIAKHMRVKDRNIDNVKLDVYLNNEVWFRGGKKPPNKIKVKATKTENIVRVELVKEPEFLKFIKKKSEKFHTKAEKKKPVKKEEEKDKKEVKSEEDKKKEKKKEQAVAQVREKAAENIARAEKHMAKGKEVQVQRKALKK
jgi:ribosomal protein L31E